MGHRNGARCRWRLFVALRPGLRSIRPSSVIRRQPLEQVRETGSEARVPIKATAPPQIFIVYPVISVRWAARLAGSL